MDLFAWFTYKHAVLLTISNIYSRFSPRALFELLLWGAHEFAGAHLMAGPGSLSKDTLQMQSRTIPWTDCSALLSVCLPTCLLRAPSLHHTHPVPTAPEEVSGTAASPRAARAELCQEAGRAGLEAAGVHSLQLPPRSLLFLSTKAGQPRKQSSCPRRSCADGRG